MCALLVAVILTALTRRDETVEYTPWCSCRVAVRNIVLRPRLTPCARHRRFNSSRLYLSLLLLLLAGDIELNPGPVPTPVDRDNVNEPIPTTDPNEVICASEASCVSCGKPPETLTLRSRPVRSTLTRCVEDHCFNFVHDQCKDAGSKNKSQHADWRCLYHLDEDSVHIQLDELPCATENIQALPHPHPIPPDSVHTQPGELPSSPSPYSPSPSNYHPTRSIPSQVNFRRLPYPVR